MPPNADKAPAFRKDLEKVVQKRNAFEQMFSGKEVLEDVTVYTDRRIRFRIPLSQSTDSGLTLRTDSIE